MFPDTPVKLLKEVFEALQLHDLIDLLEEGKPLATRLLRPALRLQEIEKLRNSDDRPISYHSSVAVLIIDFAETCDTEGIKKFFKGLNTKSEVTVMRCRNVIDAVRSFSRSLEMMKEEIKRDEQIESDLFRSHTELDIQSRLVKICKRKLTKKERGRGGMSAYHETNISLIVKPKLNHRGLYCGFMVGA